jgi:hypothetical protein
MKTKVIIQATVSVEVDEVWSDNATVKEIEKDALCAAQRRLHDLPKHFRVSDVKHVGTYLIHGD